MSTSALDRRTFVCGASVIAAAGMAGITDRALAAETEAAYTGKLPETWDAEADVVVIGCGYTGACAAISALDEGASVIVLEKAPVVGGSSG